MRKLDYDYQIGGKPMPVPDAGVEESFADLDSEDSGRDEAGFMHRIRMRPRVRTWGFTYAVLSRDEYRYLDTLLKENETFTFSFRGLDGQPEQAVCYCSQGSISLYDQRRGVYKNLKFNIIEC